MQRGFSGGSESEAQLRRISGEIEMLELGEREREWRKSYRFYEGE